MSESLRNDGCCSQEKGDNRAAADIPLDERDYYLKESIRVSETFLLVTLLREVLKKPAMPVTVLETVVLVSTLTLLMPSSEMVSMLSVKNTVTFSKCMKKLLRKTSLLSSCGSSQRFTTQWAACGLTI